MSENKNNDQTSKQVSDSSSAALLACPFCGGEAYAHAGPHPDYDNLQRWRWWIGDVTCGICSTKTETNALHYPNSYTRGANRAKGLAIKKWNTRAG